LPRLTGPLGLWWFPILNFLLQFLSKPEKTEASKQIYPLYNVERWKVVRGENGLPTEIIVYREVKAGKNHAKTVV